MYKALVTGCTGFVGRHLTKLLSENGVSVFPSNRRMANLKDYEDFKICWLDEKFDYIYHLACWVKAGDWQQSRQAQVWENNQIINTNMLRFWREEQQQAKFITLGTSCSYGADYKQESFYLYGMPDYNVTSYAFTKRMMYIGLKAYAQEYGLKYLYLIPSTIYGANFELQDNHFIFDLIRKIYDGKHLNKEVVLWGTGKQTRELTHIDDITNLMYQLRDKDNDIYNINCGKEHSIEDYAKIVCKHIGYDFKDIKFDISKYTGPLSTGLDNTKLLKTVDYKFKDLEEGLVDTIAYYTDRIKYEKRL